MEHTCSSLWQWRREDHGTHKRRNLFKKSEDVDHRHVRPVGNAISFPAYFHNHSERQCGGFPEHFPHREIVLVIHFIHITSYYITSHHITSHHITSHHITSHPITSHHITSHHITSHHITSHHIASHHITSHYITLHFITIHCITLRYITLHYVTLRFVYLRCLTFDIIALHCVTLLYITLHYVTLRYMTLDFVTLHYSTSIYASAVCVYNLSDFNDAFTGPYKFQTDAQQAWVRVPNSVPDWQVCRWAII